jgi:voltage-gated potassium channel Kch
VQTAGMSMVLGAFLAGILLADSEYRHQLEADIAPFKGLLLGLFFIAVGMSIDTSLLLSMPVRILLIVVLLMATKALILFPLGRRFGMCKRPAALKLAAVLSQGGEFAFVLFAIARTENTLPDALIDEMTLAVALSMALTPLVYWLAERGPPERDLAEQREFDTPGDSDHDVIIAGNGRVGQIVARVLAAAGKPFTALELDTRQVDLLRSYGATVYYGDASRLDLLRAAGADKARIFVLAIAELETSVHVAEVVSKNFPHLTIIARARNRRHAHVLMDIGVRYIVRETLHSSLAMSEQVLTSLGASAASAEQIVNQFLDYDNKLLLEQHAVHDSEEKLIQTARDRNEELERLLRDDLEH